MVSTSRELSLGRKCLEYLKLDSWLKPEACPPEPLMCKLFRPRVLPGAIIIWVKFWTRHTTKISDANITSGWAADIAHTKKLTRLFFNDLSTTHSLCWCSLLYVWCSLPNRCFECNNQWMIVTLETGGSYFIMVTFLCLYLGFKVSQPSKLGNS